MKLRAFNLFIFAIFFASTAFAQKPAAPVSADTAVANRYFYHAIGLTRAVSYDSANFYFLKARGLYEEFAMQHTVSIAWEMYVLCSNFVGDNLRKKGEYKNARAVLEHGVKVGKQRLGENHAIVADAYNNLGNVDALQADFDKAVEHFNASLAIYRRAHGEEHPAVARAYNNLGNVIGDKGDLDKAGDYYAKALRLRLKLFGEDHSQVATTYSNMATIDHIAGDYDEALAGFNQARTIWSRVWGEKHPNVAMCFLNSGMVQQEQGKYQEALLSLNKALELFKQAHGDSSFDVGDCYGNLGSVHAALGEHEEAIAFFEKSLTILKREVGESHPLVAARYNNIGEAYYRRGDYRKAIEFHEKDLALQQKIHGKQHWDLAQAYQELGKCYSAQNDLPRALDYYQQSLLALVPGFTDARIYSNPSLTQSLADAKLLDGLALKAEAFAKLYAVRSRDLKDLNMSLATYRLAADLIDRVRGSYKTQGSKLFLGNEAARIYGNAIRATLSAYAATKNIEHRDHAFTFAEKGKAGVLLEALQDSHARQFAGMPPQILEKEKDLRIGLSFYETEIQKEILKTGERDEMRLQEFESRHWKLKQEYEKLVARMEKSYPRYYDLKYRMRTASVADVQKALDGQTAVLEYFMSDDGIFVFVLTKSDFEISAVPRDAAFDSALAAFTGSVKTVAGKSAYLRSSALLHDFLIKPVEARVANCPRWIIIPDGELYQVPFEALLTASVAPPGKADDRALPYLLKQREISYHYSATLFLKSRNTPGTAGAGGVFAGFAPVFSAGRKNGQLPEITIPGFKAAQTDATSYLILRDGGSLEELPYSEIELQNLAAIFPNRSRIFLHEQATEENFKNNAGGYKYLHVATHGFINNENPKLSNLAFSQPPQAGSLHDGILFSGEIYNLVLDADLLVLSACQTGAGQIIKGEGLMTLTRGFFYSGARNIVASLWKVYDQHTSRLMVEFYREIAAEKGYSTALREAKLKMIANPETAAPQSWAGFVLIGK